MEKLIKFSVGLAITTIFGSLGLLGIQCITKVTNAEEKIERNLEPDYKETKRLLEQAVKISVGEDRKWSDQEKRDFLDRFGCEEKIYQEGQEINFRRTRGPYYLLPHFQGKYGRHGKDIEVILGGNLENNGEFMKGSNANSGISIGIINQSYLRKYLQNKNE